MDESAQVYVNQSEVGTGLGYLTVLQQIKQLDSVNIGLVTFTSVEGISCNIYLDTLAKGKEWLSLHYTAKSFE